MPSKPTFTLALLLEAVRERVDQTSIRAAAAEIGMSPSGLHILLRGSTPHPRTRAKLVSWYVERGRGVSDKQTLISPRDVDAALRLLVHYAKQDGRASVRARRVREIVQRLEAETIK